MKKLILPILTANILTLLFLLTFHASAQGPQTTAMPVSQATAGPTSNPLVTTTPPLQTPTQPSTSTPEPGGTLTPTASGKPTQTIPAQTPTPFPRIIPQPREVAYNISSHLFNSAIILVVGGLFAYLATRTTFLLLSQIHIGVRVFVTRLVSFAAWIGVGLAILNEFQVQVATITAIIGSVGLALSLSSQDLLKNFIAGIYILLERPFGVGDRITIGNYTGRVEFVDLRTTKLRTDEGQEVIVPNTVFLSQVVVKENRNL
jgi:small-conductance mechanosensitive channel